MHAAFGGVDARDHRESFAREVRQDDQAARLHDANNFAEDGCAVLQMVKHVDRDRAAEMPVRERQLRCIADVVRDAPRQLRVVRQERRHLLILRAGVDGDHVVSATGQRPGRDARARPDVEHGAVKAASLIDDELRRAEPIEAGRGELSGAAVEVLTLLAKRIVGQWHSRAPWLVVTPIPARRQR